MLRRPLSPSVIGSVNPFVASNRSACMNILYMRTIPIDPVRGGIGRNTTTQANYFEEKLGYKTWYLSSQPDETMQTDVRRQFYLPVIGQENACDPDNVEFFKNFLKEHKIDVVINQNGISTINTAPRNFNRLAFHCRSVGVKLLSVLRGSIKSHIVHTRYHRHAAIKRRHLGFAAPLLSLGIVQKILLARDIRRRGEHFRDLCQNSDRVVLLSEQFKPELAEYLGTKECPANVIAIPNPYPFAEIGAVDLSRKKKEILFVGRFDNPPYKRVDLAVRIWAKLFRDFPDWQFRMVGGGPELNNTKELAKKLKAERIIFEGFKPSEEFYKEASILMMTSVSEGFGMVLVEAQGAGCVPFAFKSYASVTDIIDDGKNGVLVKPFDCNLYAKKLASLMRNDALRHDMAVNAIEKAKEFSTDKIYGKWLAVLDSLLSQKT